MEERNESVRQTQLSSSPTTKPREHEEACTREGDALVNEAIKRILLDIVIRGHGDRLIGRWSREPELQEFLEQVPYMLDRINQLHMICTRVNPNQETLEHTHHPHPHHHHHYHHHHQHHHYHHRQHELHSYTSNQSTLNDLISLIGEDYHWLVRTRDSLGLTPLHKAVLFNNTHIAEYLIDRYQNELAPLSCWSHQASLSSWPHNQRDQNQDLNSDLVSRQRQRKAVDQYQQSQPSSTKLIDAQDKYGRTPLHYAGALINLPTINNDSNNLIHSQAEYHDSSSSNKRSQEQLYHYLIFRGASLKVKDFRGKTPAHYVRHPNQLRSKSVIYLSNKLNASYQANILSRTLRAQARIKTVEQQYDKGIETKKNLSTELNGYQLNQMENFLENPSNNIMLLPENNRESMSVSSYDLDLMGKQTNESNADRITRSRSSSMLKSKQDIKDNNQEEEDDSMSIGSETSKSRQQQQTAAFRQHNRFSLDSNLAKQKQQQLNENKKHNHPHLQGSIFNTSQDEEEEEDNEEDHVKARNIELAYKQLVADRCSRLILDQETKMRIKRFLSVGIIDKINDLLIEGYGEYVVQEGSVSCWNLECKRYINNVLPQLMNRVDVLHEFIAKNQLFGVKTLLNVDPILARIRRPYKRAAMNSLHLAVYFDRRVIVKYLIRRFPELIKLRDSHEATCLHWSAKSLRHDRLYNWLLEHFGHKIEHWQDSKGKTAAEYRIQAYKLFNFSETHPNVMSEQKSAQEIMKQTQIESNKMQLRGAKIQMTTKRMEPKQRHRNQVQQATGHCNGGVAKNSQKLITNRNKSNKVPETKNLGASTEVVCDKKKNVQSNKENETSNFTDHSLEISGISSGSKNALPSKEVSNNQKNDNTSKLLNDSYLNEHGQVIETNDYRLDTARKITSADTKQPKIKHTIDEQSIEAPLSDSSTLVSKQKPGVREHDLEVDRTSSSSSSTNNEDLLLFKEMAQVDSSEFNETSTTINNNSSNVNVNEARYGSVIGGSISQSTVDKRATTMNKNDNIGNIRFNEYDDDNYLEEDSPLTTPSLPLPTTTTSITCLTDSTGQQKQSTMKLEQVILDSIQREDFKKLEHFILAGCGQRILKVYDTNKNKISLSNNISHFFTIQTPEYIEKIIKIHQVLHMCYGNLRLSGPQHPETSVMNQNQLEEYLQGEVNKQFHKMCNLLDRRRLVICRDSFGASPLHVATMRADSRLIGYLIRRHPEAASAPDNDNRNACHYAALVLAAFKNHGSFSLTNTRGDDKFVGWWVVDKECEIIYNNLCNRYEELLNLKDRFGQTSRDYVSDTHVDAELGKDNHGCSDELDCCGEFQRLLQRYGYTIHFELKVLNENHTKEEIEVRNVEPNIQEIGEALSDEKYARDSTPNYSQSENQQEKQQTSSRAEKQSSSVKPKVSFSSRSKTEDNLLKNWNPHLLFEASSLNQLPSPDSIQMVSAKQIAPKPTVGSDVGFPIAITQISFNDKTSQESIAQQNGSGRNSNISTPIDKFSNSSRERRTKQQPQQHQQRKTTKKMYSSLMRELDPIKPVSPEDPAHHHHHHYHHHHHHQHRRRRHHKHDRHRRHHHKSHHHNQLEASNRNQTVAKRQAGQINSIVGGIIVPTIIHNDKMDEIETYDIIYRQPTSSQSTAQRELRRSSSSSSSISSMTRSGGDGSESRSKSSCSTCSTGSDSEDGSLNETNHSLMSSHNESSVGAISGKLVGQPVENINQHSENSLTLSESSSSSDTNDDDDERVERLSNEFEVRVRKEKCELRAKVDQIMNEIKMSAKSRKSSRFLASPIDGGKKEQDPTTSGDESGVPNHISKTLMCLLDEGRNKPNNEFKKSIKVMPPNESDITSTPVKQQQSLSSSGRSSARTSCSSASSSNSNSSHANLGPSRSSSSSTSSSYSSQRSNASNNLKNLHSTTVLKKELIIQEVDSVQPVNPRSIMIKKELAPQSPIQQNKTSQQQQHIEDTELGKLTQQIVSKNTYGQTYLHFIASRSQNSSTLYKVLDHGHYLIGERDMFYRTARDVALQFNLLNNVQVLDKFVIDLFIGGNTTLLHHLLNQGYSPLIHVSDSDGNDIMLILKLLKLDRMIAYLLQMADFQRWRDELHTFIRNGYSAGVSELIRKHADLIRAKSVHSRTSLHLAVLFDRANMVYELIEADPTSVHCVDNMGRTALHYTYGLHLKNLEEIRDCLLAKGASLDTRDVKMRTPKYYYIFKREIDEIRRLELEMN